MTCNLYSVTQSGLSADTVCQSKKLPGQDYPELRIQESLTHFQVSLTISQVSWPFPRSVWPFLFVWSFPRSVWPFPDQSGLSQGGLTFPGQFDLFQVSLTFPWAVWPFPGQADLFQVRFTLSQVNLNFSRLVWPFHWPFSGCWFFLNTESSHTDPQMGQAPPDPDQGQFDRGVFRVAPIMWHWELVHRFKCRLWRSIAFWDIAPK